MNPVVIGGVLLAVAGPLIVSTTGLSDTCSNEIVGKLAEWAPVVLGSVTAFFGHKSSVGTLRTQIATLGHLPRA